MAGSKVEAHFLSDSGRELRYPETEKISSVVVPNFSELGNITALRFIEWLQNNPGGSAALPSGNTPVHFIKSLRNLLDSWYEPQTALYLEKYGIDPAKKPDINSVRLVQIDEFYPSYP
ncbi:MAG: glucosamine-6-phosphate deaminase, partial [Fibrobacterota bacterium]